MKTVLGLIAAVLLCANFSFGQAGNGALRNDSTFVAKSSSKEKQENGKQYDQELVDILASIRQDDQYHRGQTKLVEFEFGRESEEWKSLWKAINEKDSINLLKVKNILDGRGWLGEDVVGWEGNQTLFLVIQHAGLSDQLQYLAMMRAAVRKGDASPGDLAMLEDRVALRQGKKQIYGSQLKKEISSGEYFLLPLEDPDHVDQRRAEMGLEPMQEYLSIWGLIWDVENYKKTLDPDSGEDIEF